MKAWYCPSVLHVGNPFFSTEEAEQAAVRGLSVPADSAARQKE
jgi:hypothetical protein